MPHPPIESVQPALFSNTIVGETFSKVEKWQKNVGHELLTRE